MTVWLDRLCTSEAGLISRFVASNLSWVRSVSVQDLISTRQAVLGNASAKDEQSRINKILLGNLQWDAKKKDRGPPPRKSDFDYQRQLKSQE